MKLPFLLLFFLTCTALSAQVLTGRVVNEYGEPVPYANLLVQETGEGTITDDVGAFRLPTREEGTYRVVISAIGYRNNKVSVILGLEPVEMELTLLTSDVELEEIVVSADARDPAYGIMKKVVANKEKHLRAAESYRAQVYVKATEKVDRKKQRVAKPEPDDKGLPDPFAAEEQRDRELLAGLNMLEMNLTLNYQAPRNYKEERSGVKKYGETRGLFVPRFAETDFNFYRNMVSLTGIADAPVISPLSNTAVLTYKFRLESTDVEDGQIVYKISVIPRKEGNSTVSGTLWINSDSWTINRLDFALSKYALKFFDAFSLEQDYTLHADSLWIVDRLAFNYVARQGKKVTFEGTTTLSYSDYEHNYDFPPRFFGNEIAVTTREAYQRDSSYWAGQRTVRLTPEEVRLVALRDSVDAVRNSREYQDSIQESYNKITLLEVGYEGLGFRNNAKKSHVYLASLASMVDFSPIGGFRVTPYAAYDRRFDNGQRMNLSGSVSYGLRNHDVQGAFGGWWQYNAFNLGSIDVGASRSFENINPYDAYLNYLRPSNYILNDQFRIKHRIEVVNGLFFGTSFELEMRKPIPDNFRTESFVDDVVTDEDDLLDFEPYEAFVMRNWVSYTPGLKYIREPDRKIRLQSRWPTFTLLHQKGLDGPLGSDIDFDYWQFTVEQQIILGALGTTNYEARAGRFTNTADLRFVDFKRFRESDEILFSDPTNSFQVLDTSLTTANDHLEFHVIHHFNGALINNVPFLKKTRIRSVVGGGMLYLPEDDFRYQELFAGVERVFKVGARRRLRVGAYAVVGDDNLGPVQTRFKVSFDLIDLWKRNWSF